MVEPVLEKLSEIILTMESKISYTSNKGLFNMKDKFGKSSLNIIKVKKDFFENNNKLLKENSKIFKLF